MSGGIRYRLSPTERELLDQYLFFAEGNGNPPLYESVQSYLRDKGVFLKWDDSEVQVKVEEDDQKIHFSLTCPVDKDHDPANGRLYLQDQFTLSKIDLSILDYQRSIQPHGKGFPKNSFWKKLAFDLAALPTISADHAALAEFKGQILHNLHRPFPPVMDQLREEIRVLFKGVLETTQNFSKKGRRVKMRFADPQSGLTVQREGGKIKMVLTVVLDDDPTPGIRAEKNGRIYLQDRYTIDPITLGLIEVERKFLTTPRLEAGLSKLAENLKKSPSPNPATPEFQVLVKTLLDSVGIPQESSSTVPMEEFNSERFVAQRKKIEAGREGLKVLGTLALEKTLQKSHRDQAWLKASWNALGGGRKLEEKEGQEAVMGLLKKVGKLLEENNSRLDEALKDAEPAGALEAALKSRLLEDHTVQELLAIFKNPDAESRHQDLAMFARTRLFIKESLPASAEVISEQIGNTTPAAQELAHWLKGGISVGQKLEILGHHFVRDVLAPTTLASMVLACGLAATTRLAFYSRWGFQTRMLKWGAEGAALLTEAPAFVLSEKILNSAFFTPHQQWEHLPRDLFGAVFSFGTLRGLGMASRRLNEYWAKLPVLQPFPRGVHFLQHTTTHTLTPLSLVLTNSLLRFLNLREKSPQGWKSDTVEDVLMYGHFILAGHLAHRLGFQALDPNFEKYGLEDKTVFQGGLENFLPPLGWRARMKLGWEQLLQTLAGVRPPRKTTETPVAAFQEFLPPVRRQMVSLMFPSPPELSSEGPPMAFLKPSAIPLDRGDNGGKMEWVLGRESPEVLRRGTLVDIPFSSQHPDIVARHAKIVREVRMESEHYYSAYFVVPLEGETFLNGIKIQEPAPLENSTVLTLGEKGPRLAFHYDKNTQEAALVREPIPLLPGKQEWVIGREHTQMAEKPDVIFPASENDVSRRHAAIWRNPEDGIFYLRNFSREGSQMLTYVTGEGTSENDVPLYPNVSLPLENGTRIGLGRSGTTLKFELPLGLTDQPQILFAPTEGKISGPPSPPLPAQSPVHPAFKGMGSAEIDKVVNKRPAHSIAAFLKFPKGGPHLLLANKTGWVLGKKPQSPPERSPIAVSTKAAEVEKTHAALYLSGEGEFILQDLSGGGGLYILPRKIYLKEQPLFSGPRQRVTGWTKLSGGERVFFGPEENAYYFDFWPRYIAPPEIQAETDKRGP